MNRFSGIVKVLAVFAVVVGLGFAIGWLSGSTEKAPPASHAGVEPAGPQSPEPNAPPVTPATTTPTVVIPSANPATVQPVTPVLGTTPDTSQVSTNWEDKVEEILGSEDDEVQKARQMAEVLPALPEEGQIEVAQHLSNLVADEDFGLIAGFVTNSTLSEDVLSVLIADTLNRPNSVKLPLLVDVARDPKNPKAEEAREILELFIEEDYGQDWGKWQAGVQEWLKNNPD